MKKFFVGLILVFGVMIVWTAILLLLAYGFSLFDKAIVSTIVSWTFLILAIGLIAYISLSVEESEKEKREKAIGIINKNKAIK